MNNLNFRDKAGNVVSVEKGEIVLHLATGRTLILGRVYEKFDAVVLLTLRDSSKHLMRKYGSYGFNYVLLKSVGVDIIHLIEDKVNVYMIPVDALLQIGVMYNFQNHGGYELQRFVTRDALQAYKVDEQVKIQ